MFTQTTYSYDVVVAYYDRLIAMLKSGNSTEEELDTALEKFRTAEKKYRESSSTEFLNS